MTDIEIANSIKLTKITEIAKKLSLSEDDLDLYGKYKAKIIKTPDLTKRGKLVLVTAINPTPYGEGKTTVAIGLADGLSLLKYKTILALREPSLGPVFGVKGGAAGGGYAQVAPMEDINLHFTGDFHAITAANNLIASLIDNHIKQGNDLHLDTSRIEWKRCLDLNDRALRDIEIGLGGKANGIPRKDGFNITAASEIMAVLCLSKNLADLKRRISNIVVAYDTDGKTVTAGDLKAEDSATILLKDAIYPNLVQTLEGTPAIIHGGPFANIAHGCNTVRATLTALSLADITVTEAGFGADLGAEKFLDIKCRAAGIYPDAVVLVATVRALKHNGGYSPDGTKPQIDCLKDGLANLKGHIENLTQKFKLKVVVSINRFDADTDEELAEISALCSSLNIPVAENQCWGKGGAGATELAKKVAGLLYDGKAVEQKFLYASSDTLKNKIASIAKGIYGAGAVVYSDVAESKLAVLQASKYSDFPVCIAKTQYSFSQDPKLLGRPTGFEFAIRDVELRAGSEFIVAIAGDIMLMPGLSKVPSAVKMTIDTSSREIKGLF
ncbi:MAG: formate--tetrahydrofolate ligase [Christensenellaceae bacterium]|jgi:formate--tetrahydrofolate ligase|nr:formate--tetrahydrofolate ligase [Christensenellaceae bacterium]